MTVFSLLEKTMISQNDITNVALTITVNKKLYDIQEIQ